MSLLTIILGIATACAIATYAGINVKLVEMPKGRIIEKSALYIIGIMGIPISTGISYSVSLNEAGLSYLSGVLLSVFLISVILTLIVAYSYLSYIVETAFSSEAKDDAEVDN